MTTTACHLTYTFENGSTGTFSGRHCPSLSQSYWEAVSQILTQCAKLGEAHNPDRETWTKP